MPTDSAPNILVILPHDLGDCLGCYGHPDLATPCLDQFAAEGTRLENCFAASPECTPSRAGMFTGQYTHQTGLMGLGHRGWEFDPHAVHLAQHLRDGGYQTHLFGFQHETSRSPRRLGYEHLHAQEDTHCGPVSEAVAEFLRQEARESAGPWFACVGFLEVHRSSGWPEQSSFSPEEILLPPWLPDTPAVRAEFSRYYESIRHMDAAVGTILRALAEAGETHRTLVVFTTDHGIPFPKAKSTLYDPGIRTAMMLRWPGRIMAGQVSDELISNLDLCPTILDAAGQSIPPELEGRSFLPMLQGRDYEPRQAVFGAFYYDAAYDPMAYVRTRRHKYIRSFAVTEAQTATADPAVLARRQTGAWIRADDSDVQKSAAWAALRDAPIPVEPEELYDLEADPAETLNLAQNPAAQPVRQALERQLLDMLRRTRSPLPEAHVSPDRSRTRNQRIAR